MLETLSNEQITIIFLAILGFGTFVYIALRIRNSPETEKPKQQQDPQGEPPLTKLEARINKIESELPQMKHDIEGLRNFKKMIPQQKETKGD